MLNLIRENIYRIAALVSVFFIVVFEHETNRLAGLQFLEGIVYNLYFFSFDLVLGTSVLFYLIWPFFIEPKEYDKRVVMLFMLERSIEIVFLGIFVNLSLFFFSCYGFFKQPDSVIISLGGLIRIDSYAVISKIIVLTLSLFFLFLAYTYFKRTKTFFVIEFPACAIFSILCLSNLGFVHDFFLFFLVMEAVAFITVLFTILNFSKLSVEGSIKYFIMSALAAGLFLLGCLMIYSVCLSTNFLVLHELISVKYVQGDLKCPSPTLILGLGAVFIVISVVFKLGGYPFNAYVPDVYESSPTFVVFFLAVLVKGAFFLYLIRLLVFVFFDLHLFCSIALGVSAVSSIAIGSMGGLIQNNIKRLFGYASVNQLGFLLAGLSVSNYFSFKVTIFYFFIYILVATVFLFVLSSSYNESAGRTIQYLSELKNIPILAEKVSSTIPLHLIFLISIFSMCGLPPLAGFFAKYFLMFEILKDDALPMVFFILLGSAISAFYYLKLVFQLVSYGSDDLENEYKNDKYFFESGYEFSKRRPLLSKYPVIQIMDMSSFTVFYMPIILWAFDVFSVIDFMLISIYV